MSGAVFWGVVISQDELHDVILSGEAGTLVTRQEALNSKLDLTPGIDNWTTDSPAPVQPGPDGNYPLPQPGKVKEY